MSIYGWAEDHLSRLFESTDAKSSSGSLIFHRRIHCVSVCDGIAYYGDDGMNIKALNWKTGISSFSLSFIIGIARQRECA